jgi:hypothetical protein
MKNLLGILIIVSAVTSCKTIPMGRTASNMPHPYVKLKNGPTIDAQKVTVTRSKVVTDSASYPRKNVSFYSDGKNTFGKIKKNSFAKLVYTGDINIFETIRTSSSTHYEGRSSVNPSGWSSSSHTHVLDYLQKTGSDKLYYFDYRSVKKLIKPGDPGYPYLKTFKTHRMVGDLVMVGGLGMFVGGTAIVGNSINSTSGKGQGAGFAVMLGGVGAILTGYIMTGVNHINLRRSVAKHNGLAIID